MELTAKAAKEVAKYEEKIAMFDAEIKSIRARMDDPERHRDYFVHKAMRNELDRVGNKKFNAENKMRAIQEMGISSSEKGAVLRERQSFFCIESDRSLGSTDATYIGSSKTLGGRYVKISITRWSGMMSNVKGCGSLANTTDLRTLCFLTEEEYQTLRSGEKRFAVSALGVNSVKVVRADGVAVVASN